LRAQVLVEQHDAERHLVEARTQREQLGAQAVRPRAVGTPNATSSRPARSASSSARRPSGRALSGGADALRCPGAPASRRSGSGSSKAAPAR
jgi:hypothetical protein